ncbi:protein of unknown function [Porphyromonadaceae bacterium KH3CP3RA]|nr:protein of unknown function [Porphyromonadaceae bacterium KH3CP3RA]
MKVYISGPITGIVLPVAIARFNDAELRLQEMGFDVVNPMDNGVPITAEWSEHIREDIRLMLDCNAIYLLKGWENSKGAALEKHIAEKLGFTIIEQVK